MATFEEIMAQASGSSKKGQTFDEIMLQTSKPKKSFDEIMAEASQSSEEPVTFFTATQVDDWLSSSSELGQKARNYYGNGGWVAPNDQLIEAIDTKLADAGKVQQYFTANRSKLKDPDTTISQVNSLIENLTAMRDGGKSANAVFSKFETAEEYNEAAAAAKEHEELATYDLEGTAGAFLQKTDIVNRQTDRNALYDRLVATTAEQIRTDRTKRGLVGTSGLNYTEMAKSQIDAALERMASLDPKSAEYRKESGTDLYRLAEQDRVIREALERQGYGTYDAFKADYDAEEYKRKKADYTQKGIAAYNDAISAIDFKEKSQYNSKVKDAEYRFINGETLSAKVMEKLPALIKNVQQYMSADEIAVYNYYYNKRGEEAAQSYLRTIEDVLTTRKASELFEPMKGKTFQELLFAPVAGIDQFASGIKNTVSGREDFIPASAVQKTSAQVREDLYGDGGVDGTIIRGLYDTTTAAANMAPSVLASVAASYLTTKATGSPKLGAKAGKVVGTGLMSASAKGNAYAEAINSGYTKEQANMYSTLVALSEGCLENVLGGIPQLGGAATGRVLKAVGSVDNALARIPLKIGVNMLSEGTEEGLQEMLTPLFKRIAADERESIDWGTVAESFVIGGLVGAVYSAPQIIAGDVQQTRIGNTFVNNEQMTEGLKDLAFQLPENNEARKIAESLTDEASAYRVGDLFKAVCDDFGMSEKVGTGAVIGNTLRLMEEHGEAKLADAVTPATDAVAPTATENPTVHPENVRDQPESVEPTVTITPEEIAQAKKDTGMDITVEDATEADASIDEDQVVFEAPSFSVPQIVTDENQITAYQDYFARKLSKELSRAVYFFDGLEEAGAESGFVGKNGAIYINRKSPTTRNAFSIVTGHEYVHTLEGTDEYNALRDAVFVSETFGQILDKTGMTKDQLVAQVQSCYAAAGRNLTTESAEREVVAQFVAEQLLQNVKALTEFAKTGAFAQFAVRIRRLLARMTHRLGKNKDLVKIERLLQRAVRAAEKNPAATQSGEVRSMIMTLPDGRQYVQATRQVISGDNSSLWEDQIIDYVNDVVRGGVDLQIPTTDGEVLVIDGRTAWKLGYRNGENEGKPISDDVYQTKGTAAGHIDELAEVSRYKDAKPNLKINQKRHFAKDGFEYREAYFRDFDGKYYQMTLSVGVDGLTKAVYNIGKIKKMPFPVGGSKAKTGTTPSNNRIPQNTSAVNTQSMQEQADYAQTDVAYMDAITRGDMDDAQRLVDEAAKAAMSNSKICDEDGNLIKVYHGSEATFTVFDKTKGRSSMDIQGMLFSPWEDDAAGYGSNVRSFYLNIQNPANEAIGYRMLRKHQQENYAGMQVREELERMGYDGVNNSDEEYIAFHAEQIKSADPVTYDDNGNVIPLSQRFNSDNPDIRYSIPFGFSMGADTVTQTRRSRFNRASVDEQAKQLMQTASSKGDRAELVRVLENFYEYVAQGQELSWDGINEAARPVVDWLTEHHTSRNTADVYAAEVLKEIRAISMRLTDAQKAEAAEVFGTYGEYHRKTFGSVPFNKRATITLEERWRELAEVYPEYFDPNENEVNMPIRLVEIIDSLRETNTAAEEYQRHLPEVRQDLAAAVYESYWDVSEVRSERDRYEDRVYDLKEQHRSEMLEERARGERAVAQERERGDMRVKQERQRANERERRLKEQHRVQRERAADRQTRAEMREKIRKVVKELNTMLLKGNKEKPVMNGLREAVAAALDAVQMTDAEGYEQAMQRRLAYYDQRLYEETDPQKIKQLQEEREKAAKRLESMKSRLAYLNTAYAEIIASKDATMQIYKHDAEMVKARVETVMEIVGDTPLRHMNLRQLEAVHDLYTMVKTTVDNANKIFKEGKAEELSRNAESIMDEVAEHGSLEENGYQETSKVREAFRNFTWSELKPIYAFKKLGSKTMMSLYRELRRGEDVVARDVREAAEYADSIREKYGWHEWDTEKTYSFKMPDGRTLPLTLPQMMSIYAYSKRPQAQKHIEQGGFVFSDKETFKQERGLLDVTRSSRESWRVNAWLLTEIASKMKEIDKNCMAYVDEMQEFLSKVMGEKGNEVSRVMWGIDLFKEKNYFPLKSSHDFMFEQSTVNPTMALKSSGMTKRTTPQASNPIILEGFDQVWAEHVVQMSNYHGFVVPIDNLNKVTNYAVYINEDHPQSVTTVIGSVFGKSANEYIEKLLQDVNGGVKTEGAVAFFPRLIGNAKKTAVAASASTVVQQPTAIVRAMAMVDPQYFVGKYDARKHGEKWEEVKAYAPVAILKEIGGFDTTSSRSMTDWLNQRHYKGVGAKAKALFTDSYYRDDKLMMAASKADEVGWIKIWEAVKREQKSKSKLDPTSKEFLQKCGERFTEVIEYTQVYDSTLSRSGMMRSNNEYMKMATAFMGEPTTSFNMLLDVVTDAKRKGWKKSAMNTGRVVAAVYLSQLLASAAASAIYALRDDDDDEAYLDKWAEQFGKKISSEVWVHNMIPFVRDIASIADGWDVERMDMAIFADLYNAVTSLGSESKTAYRKLEDLAGALGALGGLPVRNILRTGREAYNAVRFIFDDVTSDGTGHPLLEGVKSGWIGDAWGLLPKQGEEYERTAEAIKSGKKLPKAYREDTTVLSLVDLYEDAEKERERIEKDDSLTVAQKKEALGEYNLGAIVDKGDLGKEWTTIDGEYVSEDEAVADEATALMRRTYKSYLDLLIPSNEFQQADTAERIDMVGEVYEDVKALYKQTFKTMETEDAIETFATYNEKVSSGRYDPDLVNAYATVKLADGKPLVTHASLCKRYKSAVEEIYEARMKKVSGKYTWTADGVKNTIYTASATDEERTFIEGRERELARKDVARLYGDVDAATLAAELARYDADTVKKMH